MEKTKNQILRCAINWSDSKKYDNSYPTLEQAFIAGYELAKADYKKQDSEVAKALAQVIGAIKGGWHEGGEPAITQRFGTAFIDHLDSILNLSNSNPHETSKTKRLRHE